MQSGDYENADEGYSGDENPLDEESRDSEDDIYADTVKLSTPNYHEEADLKIDALEEESLFIPTKAIMTNTNKAEVEVFNQNDQTLKEHKYFIFSRPSKALT